MRQGKGFTIVELLIVVVVIAVLAAVTIVAYNGISNRANDAAVKSEISSFTKVLENDKTIVGAYPANTAAANQGKGIATSNGKTLTYTSTGDSFCVSVTIPARSLSYYYASAFGTTTTGLCPAINGGVVTTFAGSTAGYAEGTGVAARFDYPVGIASDTVGNLYVADLSNNRIRKVTPAGVVTTLAGSGVDGFANGTGAAAMFSSPYFIATDKTGNVYVSDLGNYRIRKITPTGVVTTLAGSGVSGSADGTGSAATFGTTVGIATDSSGNVYVSDGQTDRIRKITPAGVVTTLPAVFGTYDTSDNATLYPGIYDIEVDQAGNIYAADNGTNRIYKITPAGVASVFAGSGEPGYQNGIGQSARFDGPTGIHVDPSGIVYVLDANSPRIRAITPNGTVTTLAGAGTAGYVDATGAAARFGWVEGGLTMGPDGSLYVADNENNRIRKIQ